VIPSFHPPKTNIQIWIFWFSTGVSFIYQRCGGGPWHSRKTPLVLVRSSQWYFPDSAGALELTGTGKLASSSDLRILWLFITRIARLRTRCLRYTLRRCYRIPGHNYLRGWFLRQISLDRILEDWSWIDQEKGLRTLRYHPFSNSNNAFSIKEANCWSTGAVESRPSPTKLWRKYNESTQTAHGDNLTREGQLEPGLVIFRISSMILG